MVRGPGSNGPCLHPAGPHSHLPLPLPLALAILLPLTGDAGDHTDNATYFQRPLFSNDGLLGRIVRPRARDQV